MTDPQRGQRIWSLKCCSLFERQSADALARLEEQSRLRSFQRKETIYFPGDPGTTVLLVLEGRVKICSLTDDGKEAILEFIDPGELFGEQSLFGAADRRQDFAIAVETSSIAAVPNQALLDLVGQQPDLALRLTKYVGLKRVRIENRIRNLLFRSFRDRLLALLAELSARYGQTTNHGREINLKLSHQDIAGLIGATRETVTILLGELQLERKIRVIRRRILITDPSAFPAPPTG